MKLSGVTCHRILENVGVQAIVSYLHEHPELWNADKTRTSFPESPHSKVDDILLRFQPVSDKDTIETVIDQHESVDRPVYLGMPRFVRELVMNVFAYVGGDRLGRVMITRLKPGDAITPHVDAGTHAAYYERFHLCLQADEGSKFRIGEDWVTMKPGQLWWVDNGINHEVVNNGEIDRIHMIIDAHCYDWVTSVYRVVQ